MWPPSFVSSLSAISTLSPLTPTFPHARGKIHPPRLVMEPLALRRTAHERPLSDYGVFSLALFFSPHFHLTANVDAQQHKAKKKKKPVGLIHPHKATSGPEFPARAFKSLQNFESLNCGCERLVGSLSNWTLGWFPPERLGALVSGFHHGDDDPVKG